MNINQLDSKSIVKINRAEWDKKDFTDMHIDVNLIKCQKRLFPNSQGKKLLCIGFGEGQNLLHFLSEGFDCYGTEIAQSRLRYVEEKLKEKQKKAVLKLVDSNILPFENNFFDIVVGWEVLYYNNKSSLQEMLKEVLRVLKPNGQFLSSMLSRRHNLCKKEVDESIFQPTNSPGQENCLVYCFKNKEQIKKIYCDFSEIKIGFYASYLFKTQNYHYVIYCKKA